MSDMSDRGIDDISVNLRDPLVPHVNVHIHRARGRATGGWSNTVGIDVTDDGVTIVTNVNEAGRSFPLDAARRPTVGPVAHVLRLADGLVTSATAVRDAVRVLARALGPQTGAGRTSQEPMKISHVNVDAADGLREVSIVMSDAGNRASGVLSIYPQRPSSPQLIETGGQARSFTSSAYADELAHILSAAETLADGAKVFIPELQGLLTRFDQ